MCTRPLKAWIPKIPDHQGKKPLIFKAPPPKKSALFDPINIPCKHCIECEALRSVKQAVQMACEMHTTKGNSLFLTLTYDDENLCPRHSVHVEHMQKFIRDLRYYIKANNLPGKLRYTSRGEYGSENSRPHYHMAAFNLNLPDLEIVGINNSQGTEYYSYDSKILTDIWGKGFVHVIKLAFENCLYIAQHHFSEKVDQDIPDHQKAVIHPVTHKIIVDRNPEFSTYSSRPGIGREFFDKYCDEIFVTDSVIINGIKSSVPDYFVKKFRELDPLAHDAVKKKRIDNMIERTLGENRYKAEFDKATLGMKGLKGKTRESAGQYSKRRLAKIAYKKGNKK
jgi:hypothetical protein